MLTVHPPLDLLVAGLLSHGFREKEIAPVGWRKFERQGREARWVEEQSLTIRVGDQFESALEIPPSEDESYHRLLEKCGTIWLRTRKREETEREFRRNPAKRQRMLDLNADEMLDQLGGQNG